LTIGISSVGSDRHIQSSPEAGERVGQSVVSHPGPTTCPQWTSGDRIATSGTQRPGLPHRGGIRCRDTAPAGAVARAGGFIGVVNLFSG
jgi:hypothetical protein